MSQLQDDLQSNTQLISHVASADQPVKTAMSVASAADAKCAQLLNLNPDDMLNYKVKFLLQQDQDIGSHADSAIKLGG